MIALKNHQFDMIRSNRKLKFYSTFKTDQSISLQLELIKNVYLQQPVAKLRSGNHDLRRLETVLLGARRLGSNFPVRLKN